MIGKSACVTWKVDESKLACVVGSGELRVLATPMMLAAMEQAASQLLSQFLEKGQTSVGTHLDVSHSAATPEGMEFTAKATITAHEGRRVEFEVSAQDKTGEIGRGTHTRFIVDAERFQAKADTKREGGQK